jgi:hypothetical protein
MVHQEKSGSPGADVHILFQVFLREQIREWRKLSECPVFQQCVYFEGQFSFSESSSSKMSEKAN